jgi:glutamate racemase
MDIVVLACTHFPLVADRLAAAAPRPLRFVDGAQGIARRVAYLTREQSWPDRPALGIAVFTAPVDLPEGLRASLARYGLGGVEQL